MAGFRAWRALSDATPSQARLAQWLLPHPPSLPLRGQRRSFTGFPILRPSRRHRGTQVWPRFGHRTSPFPTKCFISHKVLSEPPISAQTPISGSFILLAQHFFVVLTLRCGILGSPDGQIAVPPPIAQGRTTADRDTSSRCVPSNKDSPTGCGRVGLCPAASYCGTRLPRNRKAGCYPGLAHSPRWTGHPSMRITSFFGS